MDKPLFRLDNRLALCAELVRENTTLADIGTDHAYLPVWLAKKGKIISAVAADIKKEPLARGQATIEKYNASSLVSTRLSNGLQEFKSNEADDIVIAGMGGEMIASILENCPWAKDGSKRYILQPMTKAVNLRKYLYENKFEIIKEETAIVDKKIYSIMLVKYSGIKTDMKEYQLYCGKLCPEKKESDKLYIRKVINALNKKSEGLKHTANGKTEAKRLENIIDELKKLTHEEED